MRIRGKFCNIWFALLLGLGCHSAQAQDSLESPNSDTGSMVNAPATKGPGGSKKVSIRFDNELIQGETANPELETLFSKQQFNFKKLIKLREHFIPEVIKGKEEYGASE